MAITVKRGDTGEGWEFPLVDSNGVAVDLTGNSGLQLKAKWDTLPLATAYKINAACTLSGLATAGVVRYAPVAANVDTAGVMLYEVEVTFPAGPRTFADAAPYIVVEPDL
ncbi:MAG: hypothetical protein M3506_00430 [Chloroflexota bacterium]|nr:hypothetical protein [Chloroflexota bacterium]